MSQSKGFVRTPEDTIVLEQNEWRTCWDFQSQHVVLSVMERDDYDDEEKSLLYAFVFELLTEWVTNASFISDTDVKYGRQAIDALCLEIVKEALKYDRPSVDDIKALQGRNFSLSAQVAYEIL